MSALRRISTRRLLAICAITVAAAIGVTAVAMAMGSGGSKPPLKPLANAVHDALSGPTLPGISPDPVHQQPRRRLQRPGDRSAARRCDGAALGLARGRRQAAPRAAVRTGGRRHPGARLRPQVRDLRQRLGNRLQGHAARRRQRRHGRRLHRRGSGPWRNRNEDHRSRRARRTERGDSLRCCRPADLHPPRRAQARWRPAGWGGDRLGREQRDAATGRDLLELVELARAAARGDRGFLRCATSALSSAPRRSRCLAPR